MGKFFESQVSNSDLTIKFIEHLMANIDRYYNAPFALYGIYLAIIGAVLTIYFSKERESQPNILFVFSSIIGQLIVFLQIIISFQIDGNYATLNHIFNKVDFISMLSSTGDSLRTNLFYFPVKRPFSAVLFIMLVANTGMFILGIKKHRFIKVVIYSLTSLVLIGGIWIDLHFFSKSYLSTTSQYLKSHYSQSTINSKK